MRSDFENEILTLYFEGRVDANSAAAVEEEIDGIIEANKPKRLTVDLSSLVYIASAGLRILLRKGKAYPLSIINASSEVYEVLDMTGFTSMFSVKKALRSISVEGCKVIGAGLSSTVYRIDAETIVKVYNKRVTLERIYSETESAKKSFVAGIPSAIPYDVVKCVDCYGTVYELLDADTLSQNFMDHPEQFNELMDKYAELLHQFHATTVAAGTFPDIREKYNTWADGLKRFMTEDEVDTIHRMINAIPNRSTIIHVDCHSRNIMVQNGELIFVDMADVSIGHPLFDIGAEYFHYIIMKTTALGAAIIFGVEPEDDTLPARVWDGLVNRYFAGLDSEDMVTVRRLLQYFGCLRCLIMVAKQAHISNEIAMQLVGIGRRDLLPHTDEAIALFQDADKYFRA